MLFPGDSAPERQFQIIRAIPDSMKNRVGKARANCRADPPDVEKQFPRQLADADLLIQQGRDAIKRLRFECGTKSKTKWFLTWDQMTYLIAVKAKKVRKISGRGDRI